jgi:dipeptidyl aminopeptidase/acylaminoacyl peptidase
VLGITAAVLTPLAAINSGTADPIVHPTNGQITWSPGDGTIRIANPDGGAARTLAADLSTLSAPVWAPDGSRFAYVTNADKRLTTKRADGTGELKLTGALTAPSGATWTADGAFLIYADGGKLYYASVDGGFAKGPLFDINHAGQDTAPAVNPDGTNTVVFSRGNGGPPQLLRYAPGDAAPTLLLDNATAPAFAPDGSKLAYLVPGSPAQVWVANADGTGGAALTSETGAGVTSFAWSPDGATILFSSDAVKKITVSSKAVGPVTGATGAAVTWQPIARNAVQRVWGQDHIATAIGASQYNYQTKTAPDPNRVPAGAVVLTRDDTFLDALVGSAFAVNQQAPLLVTNRTTLDPRVETEIKRVLGNSGKVYLLGGELALSAAINARLVSLGYSTERIFGQTHFDTAIALDNRIVPPNPGSKPAIAIVTTGTNFFDALAAGAAAGANPGTVIVLSDGDRLPPSSAAYLNGLSPDTASGGTQIVTAGGPGDRALVSAIQTRQLPAWPAQPTYKSMVGANERDTAVMIADYFFAAPPVAAIATNRTWFDALTGGAMVGLNNGPLLITDPTGLYPGVQQYLMRNSGNIWAGVLLGGPVALPQTLHAPVGDAIGLPTQWDYSEPNSPQSLTESRALVARALAGSTKR